MSLLRYLNSRNGTEMMCPLNSVAIIRFSFISQTRDTKRVCYLQFYSGNKNFRWTFCRLTFIDEVEGQLEELMQSVSLSFCPLLLFPPLVIRTVSYATESISLLKTSETWSLPSLIFERWINSLWKKAHGILQLTFEVRKRKMPLAQFHSHPKRK
jgi:hypothetical protein